MSLNGKSPYFILQVATLALLSALFLPASAARAQSVDLGAAALMIQQPTGQGEPTRLGRDQSNSEVEQSKRKVEQLQSMSFRCP